MKYRTLILVRHGQHESGALTALGRRQAARTAGRIATYPVAAIHCSTMQRAIETASILARQCRSRKMSRAHILRECLPTRTRIPGTKVPLDMFRRGRAQVDAAFRRYFRPPGSIDRCEVLVCHGNVIRYLACKALNTGSSVWLSLGTYNCGITVIRIAQNGEMILDAYNDTGHLPMNMKTRGTIREP